MAAALLNFLFKKKKCTPEKSKAQVTDGTECTPEESKAKVTQGSQCTPQKVDPGLQQETNGADENADTALSDGTLLHYFTAEFSSLGDVTHDNHLRLEEFVRLMLLLGYPSDEEEAEKLWDSLALPEGGFMALDDYLALMSKREVSSRTDTWRKLFAQFDTDGNGYASKAEVLEGLEAVGIDITPTIRGTIEGMDVNQDGKISYGEFLKAQLRQQ